MTIEEQLDAIDRAKACCRDLVHSIEDIVGAVHALPVSVKLAGAMDALDLIRQHKLADPMRRQTVREARG
jgi:hypothetical protein